jgi:hypothetical protein
MPAVRQIMYPQFSIMFFEIRVLETVVKICHCAYAPCRVVIRGNKAVAGEKSFIKNTGTYPPYYKAPPEDNNYLIIDLYVKACCLDNKSSLMGEHQNLARISGFSCPCYSNNFLDIQLFRVSVKKNNAESKRKKGNRIRFCDNARPTPNRNSKFSSFRLLFLTFIVSFLRVRSFYLHLLLVRRVSMYNLSRISPEA